MRRSDVTVIVGDRACCIFADLLVLAVIWRRTFNVKLYACRAQVEVPVTTILIQDGKVTSSFLIPSVSDSDLNRNNLPFVSIPYSKLREFNRPSIRVAILMNVAQLVVVRTTVRLLRLVNFM